MLKQTDIRTWHSTKKKIRNFLMRLYDSQMVIKLYPNLCEGGGDLHKAIYSRKLPVSCIIIEEKPSLQFTSTVLRVYGASSLYFFIFSRVQMAK